MLYPTVEARPWFGEYVDRNQLLILITYSLAWTVVDRQCVFNVHCSRNGWAGFFCSDFWWSMWFYSHDSDRLFNPYQLYFWTYSLATPRWRNLLCWIVGCKYFHQLPPTVFKRLSYLQMRILSEWSRVWLQSIGAVPYKSWLLPP